MKRTNTAKWIESAKRWQINVQKNGVRKTFTSAKPGRTGQREANKKADDWLEKGLQTRGKTVESAYAEYLERASKISGQSNYRPKESRWRIWIQPEIGHRRLESLTQQQVQAVLDNAKAAGKSRKTLQNLYGDITSFFRFARNSGYTTFTPDALHIPEGTPKPRKKILQPEDLAVLMTSDKTMFRGKEIVDPYVNAYRFAVLTGLRPGELLGLQWKDVKNGCIYLKRAINVYGEHTTGKNDNAIRAIELSDMAKSVLEAQREVTNKEKSVFGVTDEHLLYKWWRKYCAHNNIKYVSLYELRHTFVSIANVLPEGQVKALVGHSRNMDTFGVYGHSVNGQAEKIASALDAAFRSALESTH